MRPKLCERITEARAILSVLDARFRAQPNEAVEWRIIATQATALSRSARKIADQLEEDEGKE